MAWINLHHSQRVLTAVVQWMQVRRETSTCACKMSCDWSPLHEAACQPESPPGSLGAKRNYITSRPTLSVNFRCFVRVLARP